VRFNNIDEVRDTLRSLVTLEDAFQEYGIALHGVGSTHYKAICPFHDDTDPSLSIAIQKQLYRCHGCKRGGDLFTFVMAMETGTFMDAVHRIAEIAGYDLTPHTREPTPQEREEQALCGINEAAWQSLLDPFESGWPQERLFSRSVLDTYGVKYANGTPTAHGTKEQKKKLQISWTQKWDGAIVIPLRDHSGRIVGFRNKAIEGTVRMRGPDENHPVAVPPLYGLYEARAAIRERGFAIVVEGEPDVWQMAQGGHPNTVAMMGTKFGEKEIQYLLDHGVSSVVLMPDGDKAGRAFAQKVASTHRKTPLRIKLASLQDGDPDEVMLRDPEEIQTAVNTATYLFEYLIDATLRSYDLDSLTEKIDALSDLRGYFSVAPEYERTLAVGVLADRLRMEPESIEDFFRDQPDDQRSPLTNVRGERIVLAGMMAEENYASEALLELKSDHFFLAKHRRLFDVLRHLFVTGDIVGPEVVVGYLQNRNDPGLGSYARSLAQHDDPDARAFMQRDIVDKWTRRSVQRLSRDHSLRMGDTSNSAQDEIRALSASLSKVVVGDTRSLRGIEEVVRDRMADIMERVRNPTLILGHDLGPEWESLNSALRGIQRKRLTILAAPTSVGKTAIAGCWAKRFAVDLHIPTTYFTFETGDDVLSERMIANISGVESDKIVTGHMTMEEVELVQDSAQMLMAAPLMITRKGRGLQELISVARHDHMSRGTQVIFVDYLQLMHVEGFRDSRHLELGMISSSLLELANELDIAVVALAQVNREGVKKGQMGGSPKMEDTGDSYRIAQDADNFIVVRMKTKDEVSTDGAHLGNRQGWLDKNRAGRRGVGFHILADEATSRYMETKDDLLHRSPRLRQDDAGEETGERQAAPVSVHRRHSEDAGEGRRRRRPRSGRGANG